MNIIITGASKGIGRGIAKVLASQGHSLGLIARSEELLLELQKELGEKVHISPCNLGNFEQTQTAINKLIERLETVDALINNVGIVLRKSAWDISVDEWQQMLQTNVSGMFYPTKLILPQMKAQGGGKIIFISSISGRFPLPGGSAYAATKYAITGFAESLFGEVRDDGIQVCTIFPGSVDTESHKSASEDANWKVSPEEIGQACQNILSQKPGTCISRLEIRPLHRPS